MGEREVIKTVKFPDPLSKLSWEHLSRAVVSMFDKLSSENATNSMLDLGSLFDGGQIPAKQLPGEPKSPNRVPANDAPGACPPPLPSDANAKTPEPLAQQPDRVRSETAELPQRCVGDKGEDDDRPRSSKRTRRSALMVDDSPQGTQTGSTGNIGLATANASLPSSTPATGLQANPALQQHTRQQWISKANLFRGLLPACFRDLALLEEKARIHASAEKSAKKPARVSRLPVVTESNSDESPVPPSPVSECDMVTEFLRVLAEDKPNIVFLGIALLLQMSSLTKPWTQSFSTAYLAVAARVRPCLPTWDPDTLPKGKVPRQPVGDTLLPAELLRLSALPNFELLVNLHTAYAEVRLDALATCQRASSQSLTPPRDVELEALRNALKSDTARFLHSAETISISDLNIIKELISRLPENSTEKVAYQGRALWISYELSSVTRNYGAMRDYLLQMRTFVVRHGPLRRLCSYRNSCITLGRIEELLCEVEDVSAAERLQHLCLSGETKKLVVAVKQCLRSHFSALRKGKSSLSHFGVHDDGLPRVCEMLRLPLANLGKKLSSIHHDSRTCSAVLFALSCWRIATSTLALILESSVDYDRLAAFRTLPDEECTNVAKAWRVVDTAYDLLQKCWEVIDLEMSVTKHGVLSEKHTLESLCSWGIFTFKPSEEVSCGLSFGQVCRTLRLVVDSLAWRLQATGVLGLPTPEISLEFSAFVHEALDRIESRFPIHLLHPKLAVHRALCDLDNPDIDPSTASALLSCLESQNSSHVLACARGHGYASPSLQVLHLIHDLLPLISNSGSSGPLPCTSPTTSLGLRFIRNVTVAVARVLQQLSNGYQRFLDATGKAEVGDAVYPVLQGSPSSVVSAPPEPVTQPVSTEEEREDGGQSETTERCAREASMEAASGRPAWPTGGCARMGEVLAQAVHCLCGLPMRSTSGDSSGLNSSSTLSSPLSSSRFKQLVPPPRPSQTQGRSEEEEEVEAPAFAALSATSTEMPASCVLPSSPLWLTDSSLFYHTVDEHRATPGGGGGGGGPSTNAGVWWSGSSGRAPSELDWQIIEVAFVFYRPTQLPEYDSMKSLSISSELANWLSEAVKLLPRAYEEFMIPEERIDMCMTARAPIPKQVHYLSDMVNLMFYLLADYYTKNNNFELAARYYKQDLRVAPHHADSWAALALIYSSQLEQILNVIDPKTERVTARSVTACLRCFELALELQPRFITLLTERGCLAYQLHSYAARIIKKSASRSFQETHLHLCQQWHKKMLSLAYRSYLRALRLERKEADAATSPTAQHECPAEAPSSSDAEDNSSASASSQRPPVLDEEWLYHYMLTKCEEKAGPGGLNRALRSKELRAQGETYLEWVLRVIGNYQKTADVLRAAGAKYPKKIVVYNKLPYLAVEAIEVFYRTHAFTLKVLLKEGEPRPSSPCRLPLQQISEALASLSQSAFVVEPTRVATKIRCRKRPSLMPDSNVKASKPDAVCGADGPVDASIEVAPPPPIPSSPMPRDSEVALDFAPSTPAPAASTTPLSDADLWRSCVEYCREALELVLRRLPLHYKSMYRLAHLYLTLPSMLDLDKAMAILMGPFDHVTKVDYGGLFKDRRQSNFFHGVWRIPTADIDRSGNFAAHMYRSTLMVLEVLSRRGDWMRMLQVFHQLRKQPPDDKRGFLSEGDRVFLARRAFSLIHPTLRLWLARQKAQQASETSAVTLDILQQIYRLYSFAQSRSAASASSGKEMDEGGTSDASCFAELLAQAYELCPPAWDSSGANLPMHVLLKRCSELASSSPVATISPSKIMTSASRSVDVATVQISSQPS
uniref:TPR_REGION domain-containing protein n=2 Tax=Mesocestoides corti TaxID=53468 RepID=A0A5K3EV24_MESCO